MPGYISHAIMGNDLYKSLVKYSNLLKTSIDKKKLRGYSLGADLASLSKKVIKDPHNFYTQAFFIKMIKYIKDNNLQENEDIMALLYGHMAHYFLDINIHPIVYYIESESKNVGIIPNHFLVEGFYDSVLAKKIMSCDLSEIKHDFFDTINLEKKEIVELLNNVYGKIYYDYHITDEYKKTLYLFTLLEKSIKSGMFSKRFLIKISKFKEFMFKNKLTYDELLNNVNGIYTNPVTGEKHNESLIQLYNKSIDMCIEAIKDVNNYLYSDKSLSSLEKTFSDLSYDTGVSCSLGKKLIYVRKR